MSYTLILHFENRKCIDVVPNLMNPYLIQNNFKHVDLSDLINIF